MFYESLFNPSIHRPVKACLTGAGEFGASFLFQAQGMPLLEVPAVCTRTVQRAVDAYENAGIPASKVRVCESAEDAKKAYAAGFNVVVDSFEYIADLPLDVLVESSGAPEASAAAAELAIERGMHVVMVSKETDSVVGSILARKAAERGLVYTTGDGDQPSLLIGLISWGRVLGMNIVGAGKSSEYDFIYDPARDMVLCPGQKQEIATPGMGSLWQFGDRPAEEVVGKRRAMLTSLSHRSVPDLCEMAVVANATGMMPDRPLFHAPVARIDEMPDLFCPKADGGLFDAPGRLDIFNCFRRPDEASMAGGVFIVVECKDKKSWQVLKAKGPPCSRNDRYAALYHPASATEPSSVTSMIHLIATSRLKSGSHRIHLQEYRSLRFPTRSRSLFISVSDLCISTSVFCTDARSVCVLRLGSVFRISSSSQFIPSACSISLLIACGRSHRITMVGVFADALFG